MRNTVIIARKWRPWQAWALLSLVLAAAASAQALHWNLWFDLFQPQMWLIDLVEDLLLPLWIIATTMAFIRFPPPRKKLWWLFLPVPLCLLRLIEFLFTILAWSTRGFAP
jgi:hypothetical protein